MKAVDFLREVVRVSEKAACLARTIRAEEALFKLLVQEKTGEEKNKRFLQDFKTLADVLVQQTVQHDLGKLFPGLSANIFGEESNKFTNMLGETVTVEIKSSPQETADLLCMVLNGDVMAANLLAEVVHKDVDCPIDISSVDSAATIPEESVGIWIDPIDSTAQYIHGNPSVRHDTGVYTKGLQSVLVLIGAYDLTSGAPIAGVVNQPFNTRESQSNRWQGKISWGLSYQGLCAHSPIDSTSSSKAVVISSSETTEVSDKLAKEFSVIKASGGGYKIFCVIKNLVKGFVLSKPSCFKWDTCGPHAILRSLGGGVLDLRKVIDIVSKRSGAISEELVGEVVTECQLKYDVPDQENLPVGEKWSNTGGVLAYVNRSDVRDILQCLV